MEVESIASDTSNTFGSRHGVFRAAKGTLVGTIS